VATPLATRHDHRSGTTSIGQAEYGIFFLIKDADGSFRTVDEFHPCAVAAPEFAPELTPFSSDPSAGALQKVALELINVLAASPDDISGTASAVASRKTAGVPSTAPQKLDYVAAFTALSHLPPDIQSAPLNAVYRKSASSATRLWAAAALINTGDEAPLDDVKGEVANPTEEEIPATFAVASAIQAHVHSARSVPALVTIMSSSSAQIRESAAQGLRRIGTESVEKPLVAALDDPDEKVRYLAVTGLAMATGQIKQFISITAYQSDEAGYLAYWRSWATARNIK
jgi:HEAT repeat protein